MFNPTITYACGHTAELSDGAFAALCSIYNDEKRQAFLKDIQGGGAVPCMLQRKAQKAGFGSVATRAADRRHAKANRICRKRARKSTR